MRKLISSWTDTLFRLGFVRKRKPRNRRQQFNPRTLHAEPLEPREMLTTDIASLAFHQIHDNQDAAYSETGSNWQGWSESGAYQGDFRYHAAGTGANAASWTFAALPYGQYQAPPGRRAATVRPMPLSALPMVPLPWARSGSTSSLRQTTRPLTAGAGGALVSTRSPAAR